MPNLSNVKSMEAMFASCSSLELNKSIDDWNISGVENISYMFFGAKRFNQNIGSWNLQNVREINDIFHGATLFDQDIGNWRFPRLTSLNSMFERAINFNGNIGNWNVDNITEMGDLFLHAYAFNQDISKWNVGRVDYMSDMFSNAKAFNQDISGWDVSRVRSMTNMFANAISFDQNLGDWNVENVWTMNRMFNQVELSIENYDGILTGWASLARLQNNVDLDAGFSHYCSANSSRQYLRQNFGWRIDDDGIKCPSALSVQEVRLIDAVENDILYSLREDTRINLQSLRNNRFNFEVLTTEDVGSVKIELSDARIFTSVANKAPFTLFGTDGSDYLGENLSPGTYTLIATPYSGNDLTGNAGAPYLLNFKILDGVPRAFVTTWKTDNPGTSSNRTISIKTLPGEHYYYDVDWGAGSIYGGVSGNTSFTYQKPGTYIVKITGDFPGWAFENNADATKLISVDQWGDVDWETMEGAFSGCTNMDISATDIPDLSNVDSMSGMFQNCSSLQGNTAMSKWETNTVRDMSFMFSGAKAFDQDITNWDVGNTTDMTGSFLGAESFDQNLGDWNISQVGNMKDMFSSSGLSDAHYESILAAWSQLPFLQNGVRLGAQQNHYCDAAVIRKGLITDYGWNIEDGGLAINCEVNGQMPFLTSWKTDNPGFSADNQITIYTDTRWPGYDYSVDWGDGSVNDNLKGDIVHTYQFPGVYRVAIYGDFPGMHINNGGNARLRDDDKLISIDQWGDNQWDFLGLAFAGCKNMDMKATDLPDLSKQPTLFGMFADCPAFIGNESINSWNMAAIEGTAYMFHNATSFNLPLDNWDMKNVKRMYNMFKGASSFNQDIGIWNVSNVINMTKMLDGSGISNENYNKALIGWAQLPSLQNGVRLDASQNQYCEAETARQQLLDAHGWMINDAGRASSCQEDKDIDGVSDGFDQCPNTRAGVRVNANGCEAIAQTAIKVYALTTSCPGGLDGSIEIIMEESGHSLNIAIEGNGISDQFEEIESGKSFRIDNLLIGSYTVMLSVPEILFEQRFGISINEAASVTGKRAKLDGRAKKVSYIVSGSPYYEVRINGTSLQYNFDDTTEHTIQLENLHPYNEIEISGSNDCQGSIKDSFFMEDAIWVHPTIVSSEFHVQSNLGQVQLGIYDLSGKLIRHIDAIGGSNQRNTVDVGTLSPGFHLLRFTYKGQVKSIKILKQ